MGYMKKTNKTNAKIVFEFEITEEFSPETSAFYETHRWYIKCDLLGIDTKKDQKYNNPSLQMRLYDEMSKVSGRMSRMLTPEYVSMLLLDAYRKAENENKCENND